MEYYREKYRGGVIDTKTYEKMIEIIFYLEEKSYTFLEELGIGTFGSVVKVKNSSSNVERAVKIVSKDHISQGETELWPTLDHDNLLPLLSSEYVYFANSYIFVTPVHRMNLEEVVLKSSLLTEKNAFDEAVVWSKQILSAIGYLHEKSLCHLDIKGNNVLLTEDKRAIVADFGFLSSTEKPVQRYGCPYIYRCPGATMTESGPTEVNGKSFDVYAIGTTAFELFTGMALLREASKWHSLVDWHAQVYPVLQDCLQKQKFIELMCKSFPSSKKIKDKADDVISFVTSCLTIVPEKRPSIHQLQKHRLFGGIFQYVPLETHEDIWSKRVSVHEFKTIFEKKTSEDIEPETYTEEGDTSQNNTAESIDHKEKADDIKLTDSSLQNCAIDETEQTDSPSSKTDKVTETSHDVKPYCIENSQTKTLSPANMSSLQCSKTGINCHEIDAEFRLSELDVVKSDNSERSIGSGDKNSSISVAPQPSSKEIAKVITIPSDGNSSMKVHSPDITEKKRFGQNIRSWWKKRKARVVGIFTACMCRAQPSSTDEE